MAVHFHHVHLHSSDPAATIRFLEEYLDGSFVETFEAAGRTMSVVSVPGGDIRMYHKGPDGGTPNPDTASIDHLGFTVSEGFDDLIARIRADDSVTLIGDVEHPKPGVRQAFLLGPDNLKVEVITGI